MINRMSRCWPPENEDTEEIPLLDLYAPCPGCGREAPIIYSGVKEFADPLGYKMWRLRIRTKCPECQTTAQYRMGGYVVENGKFMEVGVSR